MQISSVGSGNSFAAMQQLRAKYQSANNEQGIQMSDEVKADFTQLKADMKSGNSAAIKKDQEKIKTDTTASLKSQGMSDTDITSFESFMEANGKQGGVKGPQGGHNGPPPPPPSDQNADDRTNSTSSTSSSSKLADLLKLSYQATASAFSQQQSELAVDYSA